MDSAEAAAKRLEEVFRDIHETRMCDVPILNEALRVEAVGFQDWSGDWLGILITPWFMNLMLLPGDEERHEAWRALGLGDNQAHIFPAGSFNFIVGEEEALGRFQMCSLFSPVFEFADQETAVATAEASLEALMDDGQAKVERDQHMLNIAKGDFPSEEEIADAKLHDEAARPSDGPKQVSRRELFTGQPDEEERPV